MSMNAASATVRILSLQNTQSIRLASAANVVLGEKHLRRVLKFYARYYNEMRTHRSLNKDAPASRPVQRTESVIPHPVLGSLHHCYVRV